ncbi:MAG: hypothetical protein LQ349_000624 [Xanthoria aureola]|nr:MAG: hypothetical protein LQ349_000624 [Xanthoria aureola]
MDQSSDGNSPFLKLPFEIRCMIYERYLPQPSTLRRTPPRTTAPTSKIANCGSGVVWEAAIFDEGPNGDFEGTDEHHDSPATDIADLALLLVDHQVYAEAAPLFYGRNRFLLRVGVHPHTHCNAPNWDLVDDTESIRNDHLREMRHILLAVRIFDDIGYHRVHLNWPTTFVKTSCIDIRTRLERFATRLTEKHHIRSLSIGCEGFLLSKMRLKVHLPKPVMSMKAIQNVLEPLGRIYGIECVAIGGVTLDFAIKMVNAMQRRWSSAVTKNEELYRTRKRRGPKGKIIEQQYLAQPWFQSRYTFAEELPEIPGRPREPSPVKAKDMAASGFPLNKEILDYQWNSQEQTVQIKVEPDYIHKDQVSGPFVIVLGLESQEAER